MIAAEIGTDLYRRIITFDHGDAERNDLQREVWEPTPWVIDVYTGRESLNERRLELDMIHWCYDTLGDQYWWPTKRPGVWQRGNATVNGWTWFGFATEELMKQFLERWPQEELK